eukprot:572213-Rhodomonas_salina.1
MLEAITPLSCPHAEQALHQLRRDETIAVQPSQAVIELPKSFPEELAFCRRVGFSLLQPQREAIVGADHCVFGVLVHDLGE